MSQYIDLSLVVTLQLTISLRSSLRVMGEIKTNYNQAAEVATGGLVNIN